MSTERRKSRGSEMAEGVQVLRAWGSHFSYRAELALTLKGVPFEKVEEDLSRKSPLLLEHNPIHKKVPVLLHNGRPIVESLLIVEYIDETWTQNPILPADPYARATARFWARFIDEKCSTALWMSCWTEGETQRRYMEEAKESLKILEGEVKGKRFFGGDESIGLVDIAASFLTLWLGVLQEVAGVSLIGEEEFPALCGWIKEFLGCDAVMETLPPRDALLAFFQAKKETIKATIAPVY